jgi:integrase
MASKRGNGEGTIYRRKDGRWEARYTIHTAEGRKRPPIYGKTRSEVAAKLAKAMADRDGGLVFDDEKMTVGKYLDRFLYDAVRDTIRESTFSRDEYLVTNHIKPALGRLKLKNLSALHLQGLYRECLDSGLSGSTVLKIHHVLHKALDQAVKWTLIPRNPADAVKAPSASSKEMHPLSADEARQLLEAAHGDRLEALYVLAVHTGMRRGELLGLTWEDVDLDNATVRCTGRSRA